MSTPSADNERYDVATFLRANRIRLVAVAQDRLASARLTHYAAAGRETSDERVRGLYDVLVTACDARRLDAAVSYADQLARTRRSEGTTLDEVQAAINVVEVTVWRAITEELPAEDATDALASVASVLGAIKDRIGCNYVAAGATPPKIAVDRLFEGTEGHLSDDTA